MKAHSKDSQADMTPEKALQYLREGNDRFVKNLSTNRNLLQQVNETSDGQYPFATILSCIDSRTSSELTFDQGLGDIFSIRLAGSVLNEDVLGSMEFACKIAGSKLIVVLGHSQCGAIKGACDQLQMGNLSTLLNKIQPSVYFERSVKTDRTSKNAEFVDKVARIQVKRSAESIVERSVVLRAMIESGEVGLIGAMYSIESGVVEFMDETFMLGEIRHFYLDVAQET